MKAFIRELTVLFFAIMLIVIVPGCKYDVAEPLWNNSAPTLTSSNITSIEPAQATPGVNTITIHGVNFGGSIDTTKIVLETIVIKDTTFNGDGTFTIKDSIIVKDTAITYNGVYFDNLRAEIIEFSPTAIKVRRPNLTSDTCTIKVVPDKVYQEGKFKPYKIDPVIKEYGSFNDNFPLFLVAVDNAENVYVLDRQTVSTTESHNHITKVTSSGLVTKDTLINGTVADTVKIVGNLIRDPLDGVIRNGKLYLPGIASTLNKDIVVVDLATRKWTVWRKVIGNKVLKYCDFDANGYFYVAGAKNTDLYIVNPDSSSVATTLYTGANTEILTLRVFNNYLYVAAKIDTLSGIWRHSITNGILGPKELYLDWTKVDTAFSRRTIKNIAMSSNGTMYIGTATTDPLLIVQDPATNKVDYFYKNILLPYNAHFVWGGGNFLYYISGSTTSTPAQPFKLYRVDMGSTGAPK